MIPFPAGPWEVPDDTGDGRPRLVVMSYDGVTAGAAVESVPDLVAQIFARKNAEGSAFRELRNNLLFAVADEDKVRRDAPRDGPPPRAGRAAETRTA